MTLQFHPDAIAAAHDVTIEGPGSAGVFVSPAPGDPPPTVIAGHNLSLGQSGAGGSLNGGARYGNASTVAPNFTVSGGLEHADPGIAFGDAFTDLRTLSATGAASRTRRTLTGVTAGVLGGLGALLGTAVAYLASVAFFSPGNLLAKSS